MIRFGVAKAVKARRSPSEKRVRVKFDKVEFESDFLARRGKEESLSEITRDLDITENALALRAYRRGIPYRDNGGQGVMQTRPCMCCGRSFASEGKHNRLCQPCCSSSGGISEYSIRS